MKKFLDAVSCWDNYAGSSRYGWVEEIEDPQMSARLRSLSPEDLELLTRYEGIFSDPSGTLKTPLQAVISGNLNTLADGASVRPSAR